MFFILGCHGGYMTSAFDWLKNNHGIMSESDYPYKDGVHSCKFNKSKVVAKVKEYVRVRRYSESDMKDALYNEGPLSVAINSIGL